MCVCVFTHTRHRTLHTRGLRGRGGLDFECVKHPLMPTHGQCFVRHLWAERRVAEGGPG